MVDATRSAAPTPTQPVATVTHPEAPFPPADPLPYGVAPAVTDPVSYPDFLPVDDAFALEMRAESIEQLAGGDALRRGECERIEAGRSHTNADLVAGRDRVRVHGSLHEHTGHGLAEQAAHLHTTVDGRLDVHAASEDTVLLAGHMSDLWDGGTAIVAAMTDDTAAGGGIRVTTPLDLWVHGLMGVEERIGTCTADAVLTESSATHYEREYGPGVHAAGLAVYTGSLYQSSRSSFQPLMRVSSGVRNLIAGSGGGDGGEDGRGASAPGASPPPVPAEPGAAEESATGTLAAGRSATEAPATTLDTADGLTGARRVALEELVNAVDARAAEEMGEAGTVVRAENLPELTRSTDTAEQLGALQETLRMVGAEAGSAGAGGLRESEFEGAVSVHPATGAGGALEIETPSAVYGTNAPIVRSHPDVPWGRRPQMQPQLLGGADRPPQSAAPESDLIAVSRRMRDLRTHHARFFRRDIAHDFVLAIGRLEKRVKAVFKRFDGNTRELANRQFRTTVPEKAYHLLREMAGQAGNNGDSALADRIRDALHTLDELAVRDLRALCEKHKITETIPPSALTPIQFDWSTASSQLHDLSSRFSDIRRDLHRWDFRLARNNISTQTMSCFKKFHGDPQRLGTSSSGGTKAERAYRVMMDMAQQAADSNNPGRAREIREALASVDQSTIKAVDKLTRKYGAFDVLSTQTTQVIQAMQAMQATQTMQTMRAMQLPPPTAGSSVTVASATVAPTTPWGTTVAEHRIERMADPAFPQPPGGLVHATGVPGPPPASGLPGPSFTEAAGTEAADLGRWRLDQPSTAPGSAAVEPVAAEAFVTPSLGEMSSFWLQPFEPVPAPGPVSFDSGLLHAGETAQPPPLTTAPGSAATAPGALSHAPSWVEDNFAVERRLLANELPPTFNATLLVVEARMFDQLGLADQLAARRLPLQTIDALIEGYRATDEAGGNMLIIEYLISLKESIERALRDEYPQRADPRWLERVRDFLRQRGELAAPSGASATDLPEIDRLLGAAEGVSHPAPPPFPSAPGRIEVGAGVPPPAAPGRIRPPGMSGEPHPVAFDPWSAPPGPSSQARYTETIPTAVLSTGAPPGWQGAETPGFARAASGAVELPVSRREAIVRLFGTGEALLEAELAIRTRPGALGQLATRWREVLDDLYRLHDTAQVNPAGAVVMADIDWRALETLARILDVPPPSP